MTEPFAAATACDTCGASELASWLMRSDGLAVLRCSVCGTGVVAELPGDLEEIYAGDYYGGEDDGVGYSDYGFTAEHSVGWAAALVDVLRPGGGQVLDVGCADGLLLDKLGSAFTRRCGIEMNPEMALQVQRSGHELLAHDVYDPVLDAERGRFDVVTAVAVFEHVPQFARAVRTALDLARPDGLLLFEVPLLSQENDNSAWLTSSLEHVFYPTERGLRHLFAEVLAVGLAGGELHISGYGSTFVGLASRDEAVLAAASRTWERLTAAEPAADLGPAERRARAHLLLVHAARTTPAELSLLEALPSTDLNSAVVRRFRELWTSDALRRDDAEAAVAELRAYLKAVEEARDAAQARAQEPGRASVELDALREEVDRLQSDSALLHEQFRAQADARAAATAAATDWERQAHLTHAQLEAVTGSTAWRATAPLRDAVTRARLAKTHAEVLRAQANPRRLRAALELARHGEFKAILQRVEAVHGTAVAAAGLSATVERGPRVEVQQEPWPQDAPLVSVVVVCFNYGAYVEEAVESVLRQTLRVLEVIVVDGGSTEQATLDVLDRLEAQHPAVRVLRQSGRHLVGDNRNLGISAARGRYVCCLDADDKLEPVYLELAAYLLEAHDYDVVSTSTRTFGEREETFGVLPRPSLEDMLLGNNLCTVAVFRRDLWERSGGFQDTGTGKDHIHEDWRLWVRFAALGARMINVTGQQLFLYRVHGSHSLSNLPGTPDVQRQRAAVAELNRDVLGPEALARSVKVKHEVRDVQDPFVNLVEPSSSETVTVLIAMPFLIVGGAERLLSEVTRQLRTRDFRIVIVTTLPVDPSFGDTSDWFSDATQEIYHLPRLLDVDRWERFLDYLVVSKHVDVVLLAGSAFVYSHLASLRAKHPRLKVADLLFNTVGHTAANRAHAAHIDVILVENGEVERWLVAHGELPERVVRAESGVDLERYRPSSDRPIGRPLRVGFSGRLSEEKDPLTFLAVASLMRDREDVEFVMTGAGPLEGKVVQRLTAAGNTQVQFLGVVDDVVAHLSSLDVLVLPSRLDGRPVAVLEALALGVPVVASAVGALPELVDDGVSGYLCAPGDVRAFAERLSRLADDRSLLGSMQRAARRTAELRLDARTMVDRYETTLRGLVRHRSATL